MSKNLIEIKDLSFAYVKGKDILKKINCDINEGHITVIAGPNGCGKTTLLRLMGNVLKPNSGSLNFDGKNIGSIPIKEYARSVAFVRQQNETVPVTVRDYVSLGRLPHASTFSLFLNKNDKESIDHALKVCDIITLQDKLLTELSSGQKQLARIARSLAQQPQLLLLDEPTSNLDIKHQIDTLDMIVNLVNKFSLTVVIVLHDLNLALQYADTIILIKDGRIRKEGNKDTIADYKLLEEVYETPVLVQNHKASESYSVHPISRIKCL